MTIRWTTAARAHVAPRTRDDLQAQTQRRWVHRDWDSVTRQFTWLRSSAKSDDATLAGLITRVLAFEKLPDSVTDDELAMILTLAGEQQTAALMAEIFGPRRVARLLASPPFENERQKISRKKRLPNGAVLRALLVAQKDRAIIASCREDAQAAWDAGDVEHHVQLAFAFFEDEAWRAQAIGEVMELAPSFSNVHVALVRDDDTMRKLVARCAKTDVIEYPEIVASLGDDALPILFDLEKAALGQARRVSHALAVSMFATQDAARHLAKRISHAATRSIITEYFTRHEDLAASVLPAESEGASRNAALAKELFIKVCGDRAKVADEALVGLDDPAVPAVLRDAPWRAPPEPIARLGLELSAYAPSVQIPDARRAELVAAFRARRQDKPLMTDAELKAFLARLGDDNVWGCLGDVSAPNAPTDERAIPDETVLTLFNAGKCSVDDNEMLAAFGERALPGVRAAGALALQRDVLLAVDDAYLAVDVAQRASRHHVAPWLDAHPRAAAFGLLAVVHERDKRFDAENELRRLALAGHRELILSLTPRHRVDDVRALLDRDPRLDVPPFVAALKRKVSVKRPRLRDGRALGDDVVERIFEMLAFTSAVPAYAGIDDVKRACDPRSLAEMAWDLATFADGANKWSHDDLEWMRWSIVHFADDAVIRRLTPALKHHTIVEVLEWLAIRGVRSATIEIATAFVRGDAPRSMNNISLGTTPEEIAETLLPTTELADEGTTELPYGSRTLRVGFDTTLAPILFLDQKRLTAVPRAKADDDPLAIRLAREKWDELKEDVRTIARLRVRALHHAMRERRRIPARRFLEGWATHPLGKHQARGVVWGVERGGALVTFRVAEDSSLADVNDAALVLGESELVRVPHHAELDPKLLDAWTRTFTDYQLIQPVTQLARAPIAITSAELGASKIARDIGKPYAYNVHARIFEEQDLSPYGGLEDSVARLKIDVRTNWTSGKSMCVGVELSARTANNAEIALSSVDPVLRAEALYLMRLLVEAT